MQLVNLLAYPVYDVPEQIRRRIGFNASTNALDSLSDAVAQGGESAISTPLYQEALSAIVGFDGTNEGFERPFINVSDDDKNPIQFQWESSDTGVYNFVAILIAKPINGTRTQETQYIISGYTSQADVSLGGLLPDDMVLYINDIYGLQATYETDPFGGRRLNPDSFRLLNNYVLSKSLIAEGIEENAVDIISVAKAADIVKRMRDNTGSDIEITDDTVLSPTVNAAPQLMAAQLTRPENYVAAISNAYLATTGIDSELGTVESFFVGNSSVGLESELKQRGVMRSFSNHELITAMRTALQNGLSDISGGWKASNKASFTLADLRSAIINPLRLDECIRDSLTVAARRGLGAGAISQTDSWLGRNGFATQASLVAYDLAMSIAPIMSRNLIGEVTFIYDNRNTDIMAEPICQPLPNSTSSIVHNQLPHALGRRFLQNIKEMMLQVTKHNQIRCNVVVTALLGTVTRIEVSVDGEPVEYFTYASFMQFRLHSGNTNDRRYVGRLAKNTAGLLKAVEEGYHEHETRQGQSRMLSNVPSLGSSLSLSSNSLGGLSGSDTLGGLGSDLSLNTTTLGKGLL